MIKKLFFLIFPLFIFISPAICATDLKLPQGRIGIGTSTEKYNSFINMNITNEEINKINELIKVENKEHKKIKNKTDNDKLVKRNKGISKSNNVEKKSNSPKNKNTDSNNKSRNYSSKQIVVVKNETKPKKVKNVTVQKETLTQKIAKAKQERIDKKNAKLEKKIQKQKELEKYQQERIAKAREKVKITRALRKKKIVSNDEEQNNSENISDTLNVEQSNEENISTEINDTVEQNIAKENTVKYSENTNQDIETRLIINEISEELTESREKMLKDLSVLWVSAVQKSDTVYFAIMKLSNPNADEVNKKGYKKILEPIIGAAPLIGQAFVNPALTAGSLIGSNVMGTMLNDNATKRLAKVNDADLVILSRAIDELQKTLLVNYMSYKAALLEYKMAIKIADDRRLEYERLNQSGSPNVILANTFYTEALDNQYKMRQEFIMKRVVLEQMVGSDAINEIEKDDSIITPDVQENNFDAQVNK